MKSKFSKILTSVFVLCLALTLCLAMTACDDTINELKNEFGVFIEGEFEKGAQLIFERIDDDKKAEIIEKIVEQDYSKYADVFVYDIAVVKDNAKLQPNGNVKVSIPVENLDETRNYMVMHLLDDDSVEVLDATVSDGRVTFETSSFSYFVIAEKPIDCTVHNFEGAEWINGQNGHFQVCINCHNAISEEEPHYGGTATCVECAKCEACGAEYGDLSTEHNYEGAEWIEGQTGHFKNCVDCQNAPTEEEPHEWDAGVEKTDPDTGETYIEYTCTICGATKRESSGV